MPDAIQGGDTVAFSSLLLTQTGNVAMAPRPGVVAFTVGAARLSGRVVLLALLAAVGLCSGPAFAQLAGTGAISGTVQDLPGR